MSLSSKLLTAGAFLAFFAFGFVDNLKGPLLPEILRVEKMSYAEGGTFFLAAYIGFIVATLASGVLADMLSNRRVLLLSAVCLVIGAGGLNATSSLPLLNLFMAILGFGLGGIEVGANALMVELHSAQRARYLNLLATFHGVGSLLVPLVAAWLISVPLKWPQIYLCTAVLALPLIGIFTLTSPVSADKRGETVTGWSWRELVQVGFSWRMGWFYLLICAYVAVELGVAAWLVEYLQKEQQISVSRSSFYLSGFFAMIMFGRFFGSWWVERVGYLRMIALALTGTLTCLTAGLFGPAEWRLLLPISGLFMSIVFPTVTAAVAAAHPSNVGSIFGILFTFGGIGGALGPWTIGLVSQAFGLRWGLASTIAFCVIALIALTVLARTQSSASVGSETE
ncbi:MAG: MFS transporter [Aureliella sp.]